MWLLPSRRRPDNLARFAAACKRTGTMTPGLVLIDKHDYEAHHERYSEIGLALPPGWHIYVTIGESQGDKIRELWDVLRSSPWLGLIGDDCVPETPGWDRKLVDHLSHALIVSCNDGWQAPTRAGNCWVIAGDLVRELDYLFPGKLQHLYVDDVWEAIGRDSGTWHVAMDVLVSHRHVLKGEAPVDDTHLLVYGQRNAAGNFTGGGMWPGDSKEFERWQRDERERAVAAARRLRPQAPDAAADDPIDRTDATVQNRVARVKSRKVMICTPVHGDTKWQYTYSLFATMDICEQMGVAITLQFVVGSSNLPKARNELCAWFLQSECTDLLFIDADMGWDPNEVLRLLASEEPLVAVVGRRKSPGDPSWCVRLLPGSHLNLTQNAMGFVEVLSVGTGMMRITRECLEKIVAARPDLKRKDPKMDPKAAAHYYKFFSFDDDDGGEDYHFCALWRSLGGKVWIDPDAPLTHVGDHEWKGRFGDALTALPAADKEAA